MAARWFNCLQWNGQAHVLRRNFPSACAGFCKPMSNVLFFVPNAPTGSHVSMSLPRPQAVVDVGLQHGLPEGAGALSEETVRRNHARHLGPGTQSEHNRGQRRARCSDIKQTPATRPPTWKCAKPLGKQSFKRGLCTSMLVGGYRPPASPQLPRIALIR